MNTQDLLEYLQQHSKIIDHFKTKMINHENQLNAKRPNGKRFDNHKIDLRVTANVTQFVENIRSKLAVSIEKDHYQPKFIWVNDLDAREDFLEELDEMVDEIEFD